MKRASKILAGIAAAAVLGVGIAGLPPLFQPRVAVADAPVDSIKSAPEYQDTELLGQAWRLPVAHLYQQIEFQRNGSVCGPTSLANVSRTLGNPLDQKGILEGTGISTVMGYLPQGLTLDQVAKVAAQKIKGQVAVLRGLSYAEFKAELLRSNEPDRRYVINFTRQRLFGSGYGHFSPIAGYLEDQDLVLVLDVNQDYGPWLVKSARLYAAMDTVDNDAHAKRGLLLIESAKQ